ncbi:GRIP and coiled-coil domain-containing protein 1 isoform X2 [Anabrus simplex]|uniref:GRIP and coiled-coil domain-containing protein 1 isoform X2 n=1 Tax=Anabrus simplex TaxID=316456 RepID=UPI0035A2E9D4
MEKYSKKELVSIVGKQNEQITRYESRLRDVVIAYKGLIKEKEALEASVKALSVSTAPSNLVSQSSSKQQNSSDGGKDDEGTTGASSETTPEGEETREQLHQQLTTLTNSLATLSAEKSRMEASFQADKKQLRQEKEEREKVIKELQEKNQLLSNEIENLKSKLIVERHERDKEQSDHGVMIRELQKLLSEERRQKELAESQMEELKSKLSQTELQSGQNDKRLRDIRNELEAARRKLKRTENELKAKETPPLLLELQDEIAGLRRQHSAAISQEQKRAADAEERARKLAAVHEERVANLEARLAELSETVGTYDRLRQQDQRAIMKLKEHIAQLDLEQSTMTSKVSEQNEPFKERSEADVSMDLQALVKKIQALREQLVLANQNADKPIDLHEVLCVDETCPLDSHDDHDACHAEIERLQHELEWLKKQKLVQLPNTLRNDDSDMSGLVNALKERIRLLNTQMDEKEDQKQKMEQLQKMLKAERARCKSELSACENDYRSRIALLEQQLLKQRERTLKLLDDKEQEIRMLKSTFGMFLPGNNTQLSNAEQHLETAMGGSDDVLKNLSQFSLGPTGGGESPHMLHYAHELARRDVEISTLRKTNHKLETTVRELQRLSTTEQERHQDRVNELNEEIARLERCKSREGANLEYLKNVVLSFLLSSDPNCKRPMLNAIAAVLKFSCSELERVNRVHNAIGP